MRGGGKMNAHFLAPTKAPGSLAAAMATVWAMNYPAPATCSLGAGALEERLAAIAAIGADSLISHHAEDNRHLLCFRADAATRQRLDEIVAAEAECCSSLELSLDRKEDELVLTIAAPRQSQVLADGLAGAFAGLPLSAARSGPARQDQPRPAAT
jgi:AcrR family transcriptional regulator